MKKYVAPEMEIEKFNIAPSIMTNSNTDTDNPDTEF